MFLEKYLNPLYLDLVYDNYDDNYIKTLDEKGFSEVYTLFRNKGFYLIDDIILNYLELFEMDVQEVEKSLLNIKKILGDSYIKIIGQDMTWINKIIDYILFEEE